MVEQSTRKKQKPCGSNLIKLGWTNTSGPLFIRNGNRKSLNLWISSISLSCLPWYWLHVQRPFTLCWLGLNCCVFGSTLNAEPTVVISRTDSATEKTSGTVFAIMLVPAACTPPPPPFGLMVVHPLGRLSLSILDLGTGHAMGLLGFCIERSRKREGKNISVISKVHPPCLCFGDRIALGYSPKESCFFPFSHVVIQRRAHLKWHKRIFLLSSSREISSQDILSSFLTFFLTCCSLHAVVSFQVQFS